MSNTKSKLVFDFPDLSPGFDFDDAPKKVSKLGKNRFGKLKAGAGRAASKSGGKASNSVINTTSSSKSKRPSPDKSTATTASASSFDESAFDDFDDEVFDFGRKRGVASQHGKGRAAAAAGGVVNGQTSRPVAAQQHFDPIALSTPPSTKQSFEFADSTSHKPLKLPSHNQPHGLHRRISSAHSNTGYISEVSEFSFDRVTVNTVGTGVTGVSSNVSWNFFDEAKDLGMTTSSSGNTQNHADKHGLGFVPYTGNYANDDDIAGSGAGGSSSKKSVNIRSLLGDDVNQAANTNATTSNPTHPFNNNNNNNDSSRRQIQINMDHISLSDRSNELPISGIVSSSSNQSIISEISDIIMNNEDEEKLSEVVKMLKEDDKNDGDDYCRTKTPTPLPAAATPSMLQNKTNSTPTSLNYSEDPTSKHPSLSQQPSIFKEFEQYKMQRLSRQQQQQHRDGSDANNSRSANCNNHNSNANTENSNNNSMFESVIKNVCMSLEFCTWYLCGTDTTQQQQLGKNNKKEMSKEERQKEMDDRFLGKFVFCNCHDLGCGMTNVLL